MDEHRDILSELIDKIGRIRRKLDAIIKQKQEEIKKFKELDGKYSTIEDILRLNIPVDTETTPFFVTVGNTLDFVEGQIAELESQSSVGDLPFYSATTSGTNIAASLSSSPSLIHFIPNNIKKKIYIYISGDHEKRKIKVTEFLKKISPHLVSIYYSAYDNLEIIPNDSERGAIVLMREVVDQVLGLLAPDENIKKNQEWFVAEPSSNTRVTRKHRVRFIAEKMAKNTAYKDLIIENTEVFELTVKALSKYHKRGLLNKEEAKLFFFQAEELLEILCDSIVISVN